jgi:hypothetical protein
MSKHGQETTNGKDIDARFAQGTSWVARQAGSPWAFASAALRL